MKYNIYSVLTNSSLPFQERLKLIQETLPYGVNLAVDDSNSRLNVNLTLKLVISRNNLISDLIESLQTIILDDGEALRLPLQ